MEVSGRSPKFMVCFSGRNGATFLSFVFAHGAGAFAWATLDRPHTYPILPLPWRRGSGHLGGHLLKATESPHLETPRAFLRWLVAPQVLLRGETGGHCALDGASGGCLLIKGFPASLQDAK